MVALPDVRDVNSVVTDYANALSLQEFTQEELAKIVLHCEEAFSLVIRAGELMQSYGVMEQTIFLAFMNDLVLMRRDVLQ